MEFEGSIIYYLLGLISGAGLIAFIAWLINIHNLSNIQNPKHELNSLKSEMQSIHSTI